jgi:bifunctional non-homologous end joining protein LigD
MGLKTYRAKRNFRQTREPSGSASKISGKNFFVVQKHDATRLHYDFRLAMEGVLKSWAVPKGFPTTKGDRRLAVQLEDHPLEYAQFEGIIPKGNYGAGTVMVWDLGTYEVECGEPVKALESGKFHLTLKGKKLKGEWILVRMKPREHEDKPQWLLMKGGADLSPFSPRAEDRSVLTGRSLKKIAADQDARWQSDRPASRKPAVPVSARRRRAVEPKSVVSAAKPEQVDVNLSRLPKRKSGFVAPMKAASRDELPKGLDWIYELKFDGVRALAIKKARGVELISRNAKDFSGNYPGVLDALKALPCREAVLDGEIVALDATGKSSFQLLQSANLPGETNPPIFYYVFDLIQLDGRDLTGLPLFRRKAAAQAMVATVSGPIRFSAGIQSDPDRLIKELKRRGLEGVIAKRTESKYEIGARSGAWVKFKWTCQQEFVIGGYTEPRGARTYFGAVLVGFYERGKLRFASKVGTGFDQRLLKSLHEKFQKLRRPDCPFVNLPEKGSSSGGVTMAEMKRCTWVEPKLVCQVRFTEWTRDDHLRQPAFLGLREDKRPKEVGREKPA